MSTGRFAAFLARAWERLGSGRPAAGAPSAIAGWSGSLHPSADLAASLQPMREQLAGGTPHEADFRYFHRLTAGDGTFLDVGANVGQSAVSVRAVSDVAIVSFEPNPLLEPVLRAVSELLPDHAYHVLGLSDVAGSSDLHVPVIDGYHVTPLATFDPSLFSRPLFDRQLRELSRDGSYEVVQVRVDSVRLDDLSLSPAAIKIDTEEHELACLRGMESTLSRCRPTLMIEDNPQQPAIAEWLAARGYVPRLYDPDLDELVPFERRPDLVNVFYLPREG